MTGSSRSVFFKSFTLARLLFVVMLACEAGDVAGGNGSSSPGISLPTVVVELQDPC